MPENNPEQNPEFRNTLGPEAGAEFYDQAQVRKFATEAEKNIHADKTAEILQFKPKETAPTAEVKELSDEVMRYIQELKDSKDPVATLNLWMSKVSSGAMNPADVAEAMAWKDEQEKQLPKAA